LFGHKHFAITRAQQAIPPPTNPPPLPYIVCSIVYSSSSSLYKNVTLLAKEEEFDRFVIEIQ
jgi:hypothetical protein